MYMGIGRKHIISKTQSRCKDGVYYQTNGCLLRTDKDECLKGEVCVKQKRWAHILHTLLGICELMGVCEIRVYDVKIGVIRKAHTFL